MTALVVRYMDSRPARMHDGTDDGGDEDVCIVYPGDTIPAAAAWFLAERRFERCRRSDALAEVVLVTVLAPDDPAVLEARLQEAAQAATVTWGYVQIADFYAEAG